MALKELKTRCHNCGTKLYQGKFYIYGASKYRYCSLECGAAKRLEQLRKEIRAERISYGEITELQSLAKYIDKSDSELLAWAWR